MNEDKIFEEIELQIEYLNKQGWVKVNGYKLDVENIGSYDYEYLFLEKDNDLVTETSFWKDIDDNDESCFDCIDEAVDYVEDTVEESFEDFKRHKQKLQEKKE